MLPSVSNLLTSAVNPIIYGVPKRFAMLPLSIPHAKVHNSR